MSKNISQQLVDFLDEAGVKRIYGIVGDSLNPFTEAIHKNGHIKWVHVRHEETAAYAASAEAQITGDMAVCCGSSGPGNLHLINGLFDAHHSHAPVLAIASHLPLSQVGTDYFQETHPQILFKECSAYVELISVPSQVIPVSKGAINTALTRRDVGIIVLPGDVAGQAADDEDQSRILPPPRPVVKPNDEELADFAELLNRSRRITFFCGAGCAEAHDEVVALAKKVKAPIAYSLRGKEYMEYDNPMAIGMTGLLGWGDAYRAMHECDLLVLWGTDFPYSAFLPTKPTIVQVDIRAEHVGRRCRLDMGLCGDVKETIKALDPMVQEKKEDDHLTLSLKKHANTLKRINAYIEGATSSSPIRPEYLATVVNKQADTDAVFTVDTGTPCIWASRYLCGTMGRRILGSFKHGSMACALAMAIGAQMACPGRQVIAFCGDGGLSMLPGDLITLIQYNLPVKLVVFNNDCLDFIKLEMEAVGLIPREVDLHNPDFSRVAQAIGMYGERVENPANLESAVSRMLKYDGPALLDVVVDKNALSLPPHITLDQAKGFSLSLAKQALSGGFSNVWETLMSNRKLM